MSGPGDRKDGEDEIALAVIGRSRGNRGEVFLHPHFDVRDEDLEGLQVTARWPDGRRRSLRIASLWWHLDKLICRFEDCNTMGDAKALTHGEILIPRDRLKPLEEGEYFVSDLIGCEVRLPSGAAIGVVAAASDTSGHALLEIKAAGGREILVPLADSIVVEIDLEARRITIDPPEGLLELNES